MNKNSKRFMRDSIRRSKRLVENLPVVKCNNKIYHKLVQLELQYKID